MRTGLIVVAMMAGLSLAGCKKADNGENTVSDTTTTTGMDTVNVPTAVPTTDTVITTTNMDVDTIHGKTNKDSIKR